MSITTIRVDLEACFCCNSEKNLKSVIDTHLCDQMDVKTVKIELSRPICARCRREAMNRIRARFGPGQELPTAKDLYEAVKWVRDNGRLGCTGSTVTGETGATGLRYTGSAGKTGRANTGAWSYKGPNRSPRKLARIGRGR